MKNLTLGEKIIIYRKRAGLKQYVLSEMAGISSLTLIRIESGTSKTKPQESTLRAIAGALGVEVSSLKGE